MTVNSVPKCNFYSSKSCFIFCRKIFNIFYNFNILAKSVFSFTIFLEITLSSTFSQGEELKLLDFACYCVFVFKCIFGGGHFTPFIIPH